MNDRIEREVKLRFDSREAARAAVIALDATPKRTRRLQDDRLLDTAAGTLRAQRCTLRLRAEWTDADTTAPVATVTFKGAPWPDVMKVREEIETHVDQGDVLLEIFEKAGWQVWFRYQKYREEFEHRGIVIAIDETPVGIFVELEGEARGIAELAVALGRTPHDYIVASYYHLYCDRCAKTGRPVTHMVFD